MNYQPKIAELPTSGNKNSTVVITFRLIYERKHQLLNLYSRIYLCIYRSILLKSKLI